VPEIDGKKEKFEEETKEERNWTNNNTTVKDEDRDKSI